MKPHGPSPCGSYILCAECQLVTYMLIFPDEKPSPILVAWPALAGGPGSLGLDCAVPSYSHSEAHAH